jgi:hypothetical protein
MIGVSTIYSADKDDKSEKIRSLELSKTTYMSASTVPIECPIAQGDSRGGGIQTTPMRSGRI